MDLTTQTPVEIDEALAEIYTRYYGLGREIDQQERYAKDLRKGIEKDASGKYGRMYASYTQESLAKVNAKIATLRADAAKVMAEADPFDAEFTRRGRWTRFFLVKNNGGHIHSSMNCSTCNKMGKATEFGWLPNLSGQSEAEAVAAHGAILCTTCYSTAPTEWTDGRKADDDLYCTGGGRYYIQPSRTGYYSGNWGTCPVCEKPQTVSKAGSIRKHKKV